MFTNEHLALIAPQRPTSATALQGIAGIGDGKVARYGERVLAIVGSFGRRVVDPKGGPEAHGSNDPTEPPPDAPA